MPARTPEQVVRDLAGAFSRLAGDPTLRIRFGRAAQRRVEVDFNWDKKGEWMNRIYSLANNGHTPIHNTEMVAPLLNSKKNP